MRRGSNGGVANRISGRGEPTAPCRIAMPPCGSGGPRTMCAGERIGAIPDGGAIYPGPCVKPGGICIVGKPRGAYIGAYPGGGMGSQTGGAAPILGGGIPSGGCDAGRNGEG